MKRKKSKSAENENDLKIKKSETRSGKSEDLEPDDVSEEIQSKGRPYTISVALPGSILENAQSPELRTYLAGQIARSLVIFNIDEVVVFNETTKKDSKSGFKGSTKATDPNILLARILQYLECPQYLRKHFFPKHPDLNYAGLLNPLDSPHHMRVDDELPYREGVVLDRPVKNGEGSFVNIGLRKEVKVDKHLQPGIRVTVKIESSEKKHTTGKVVSPAEPRLKNGLYWGYNVRLAQSFGAVFTQCPFKDGYDVTIGTSERGSPVRKLRLSPFKHLLIVFGGLGGLEASLESDESLMQSEAQLLFDHYINSCSNQGSRTIRTEEAILITLSGLQPRIQKCLKKT
ncbi:putative methyltransferase C9orf114 [Rhopilema esculentum]|uniref:putative methyltransferase C9orf114 n=1 Tax=Rhopilema esculentum TaxID=499914 RepID=UPI0031DA5129